VILDIDEKSLAEQGRWPWGRDKLALLMDKLFNHYGMRLVGFDVVFAEPDDSSGLRTLDALAKKELRDVPPMRRRCANCDPQLDNDARFAASLKNHPVILGYYFSSKEGVASVPAPRRSRFSRQERLPGVALDSPSGSAMAATCPNSRKLRRVRAFQPAGRPGRYLPPGALAGRAQRSVL
jgi:CHASE2 domain-containing sensor protein